MLSSLAFQRVLFVSFRYILLLFDRRIISKSKYIQVYQAIYFLYSIEIQFLYFFVDNLIDKKISADKWFIRKSFYVIFDSFQKYLEVLNLQGKKFIYQFKFWRKNEERKISFRNVKTIDLHVQVMRYFLDVDQRT